MTKDPVSTEPLTPVFNRCQPPGEIDSNHSIDPSIGTPPWVWIGRILLALFIFGTVALGDIYTGTLSLFGREIPRIGAWQILYALGFIGYALLLFSFRHRPVSTRAILIAAILLRLPLLLCPPNNDCNRYAWEGMIQRHGFNPYTVSPEDPVVAHLRDDVWEGINKKHYSTIYPPLSEIEFRFLSTIHYSIKTPQVAHVLWDMGVIVFLAVLLSRGRRPAWYLAIYALCPLVLASFAHSGHNDTLMILGLLGFLTAGERKKWLIAGVSLGLAILAKTTPMILLVLLVRRSRLAIGAALLTVGLGYLLYMDAGSKLFFALTDFPTRSSFNNPFDAVRIWFRDNTEHVMFLRERNYIALAILACATAYRVWRPRDLLSDARWLLAIVILLLPIIHFWYLSWIVVLIALSPRGCWAWLLLTGTMVFYWQADLAWQMGGRWKLPLWAACVIWIPFFVAWIAEWISARRSYHPAPNTLLTRPDASRDG
ncbi:MAG: glycosyltransferase 87 family protein [Phycisphaerae bacterium]